VNLVLKKDLKLQPLVKKLKLNKDILLLERVLEGVESSEEELSSSIMTGDEENPGASNVICLGSQRVQLADMPNEHSEEEKPLYMKEDHKNMKPSDCMTLNREITKKILDTPLAK